MSGLFTSLVRAEQLMFKQTTTPDAYAFSYQWLDAQLAPQSISFELPKASVEASPIRQPNYKPEIAQRYVTVTLLKEAQKVDPRDARINIAPNRGSIDIKVKSRDSKKAQALSQHLQQIHDDTFNEYLETRYFTRFTTIFNQRAIKPDHLRYIRESVKTLVPVSQAFYEKIKENSDPRAYFSMLLGWIQSIPYDALEDRVTSNGSGFAPPVGLLFQNLGDCDSKAVLASSMVRAFLPSTKMIMVLLPNHALVGVALTAKDGDTTLQHNGQTYILYDPTGPALIPFGQVSKDTERYIATGRYQVEEVE